MKKRTKRKVRPLLYNPIGYVIEGACITSQEKLNELRVRELQSIEAFAKGHATLGDWRDLTALEAVAETMAKAGIGRDEVLPVCAKVEAELIAAAERFERTGKMGLTGPGLVAVRELYEYHDLQRSSVPRSEYERFIRLTGNRIRSLATGIRIIE